MFVLTPTAPLALLFDTSEQEAERDRLLENAQVVADAVQKNIYEDFLRSFEKLPEQLSEFSLDTFNGLIDYMTVGSDGSIDVTFRNGQTIKA